MTLSTNILPGDPGLAGLLNETRGAVNGKPDGFADLEDTPETLTGEGGNIAVVNAAGTELVWMVPAAAVLRVPNVQTDDYTLAAGDAAAAVEMDKATAVGVTVPPNGDVPFPVGTMIPITQVGDGVVSVVEGAGVTVDTFGTLDVAGQWGTVWLRKRSEDGWLLSGDVEVGS